MGWRMWSLKEFEDLQTDQIHAKHLAVVNVEENRAVLRLCSAYVTRDSEHESVGEPSDFPLCCRMSLWTEAQSSYIYFC